MKENKDFNNGKAEKLQSVFEDSFKRVKASIGSSTLAYSTDPPTP